MHKSLYNWDTVDWKQQDVVIAHTLGCSKERVRQKRFMLKLPRAINYGKRVYKAPIKCIVEAQRRKLPIECMTTSQIAKALRINHSTVRKHFPNRKSHKIDWNLITDKMFKNTSDEQLAKKLGCTKAHVIHQRLKRGIYRAKPWQDWSKIPIRELLAGNVRLIAKKMNRNPATVRYHIRKVKRS